MLDPRSEILDPRYGIRDVKYMKMALKLAEKGAGEVSPNPMVGAVVVKNNKIIGRGFHEFFGGPHAEIYALRQAGKKAKGATLYVNLEPCRHFGKTPPCIREIIKSGIKRAVVAMKDPNPLNNGKGLDELRRKGIDINLGVCRQQAEKLNESFSKYIAAKKPFAIAKIAQSLDGKTATKTGDSRWISGAQAREYVHKIRQRVDAILVGVQTILNDDPLLSARNDIFDPKSLPLRQPVKIVVDSKLRVPLGAKIFSKDSPGNAIIATTKNADKRKLGALRQKGVNVLEISSNGKGKVDLKDLFSELGQRGISSVMVEGGGNVIASALKARVIDKVLLFIAPKFIGGKDAKTSVEGEGIDRISQALHLKEVDVKRIGEDILIEGYL